MVPVVCAVPSGQESSGASALTTLETRSWEDATQKVSLRNIPTCKQTYCLDVSKHEKEALSSLNKGAELSTQLIRKQISNPCKILIPP